MYILKILKPIRMNGEIVQPGQMVKVINERGLIEKGYARRLSSDEAQTILNEYVKCAENIFPEVSEKKIRSANKGHKAVYQDRLF
jgi:hypothetical protein